jgi:nitrite reductase/ring-hydroxylating ferredoxin subunit
MTTPYPVCKASELAPGGRRIVDCGGKSIGVFNVKGSYYALRNMCPHQFAPICLGTITGTSIPGQVGEYGWQKEGEIIRCPWHAWEFEIATGRSIFNPHKVRVKTYEVSVEASTDLATTGQEEEESEKQLETFPVTVTDGMVIVHA